MMKLWTRVPFTAIFVTFFLVGQPMPADAQQAGGDQTRQERIREHQERIKKILEESKKRRDEQQKALQEQQGTQPPAAPGAPAPAVPGATPAANPAPNAQGGAPVAGVPGQPLPTGPVQNARMTPPVQAAAPTPAAQAPQTARSESRTILLFNPLDSIVNVGERFKTSVQAETKEGEIDEISLFIKYPRHILNPLALNHSPLDPYVKKIDYEFNPDDGTIYLHANLKEPQRFAQKPVISIVWEALEPTDGAAISYEFGDTKYTTGLYLNDSNLLGTLPGSNDGVIKSMVQVIGPRTKPTLTQLDDGVLIGSPPAASSDDRPDEDVSLQLRPSSTSVKAGDTFDVDVILKNPGEERIDRVRLYLQFNPADLEVVDSDAGNIVTRGINIRDAASRGTFAFDYYRFNTADNSKGTIIYEVSASNSQVRGSGKLATISMRALGESPRTELILVQNAKGLTPTSEVSFLGESKLETAAAAEAQALEGTAVRVIGQAIASQQLEAAKDLYNPFESNLARRMRNIQD